MSPEFEAWLRRSLDFLSAKLSPERAIEAVSDLIRENPELYNEFIRDARVLSVEVPLRQNDLLN